MANISSHHTHPTGRRRWGYRLGLAAAATALVLAGCSKGGAGAVDGPTTPSTQAPSKANTNASQSIAAASQCKWSACSQVLSWVSAGTSVDTVPANMSPSLSSALELLQPPVGYFQCLLSLTAVTTPSHCIDGTEPKHLVLFGDSHALMWSRAIADIAQKNGYSVLLLLKLGCPMPMLPFWNNVSNTPNTQCLSWKQSSLKLIANFDPSVVIVTTQYFTPVATPGHSYTLQQYSDGLVTTLKDVSAPGRRVILLGDTPFMLQETPQCLAAHETDVQVCSAATSQAVFASHDQAQSDAAKAAGAGFIDVVPWFCTQSTCPPIIDNTLVYRDVGHITMPFEALMEPILAEALGFPKT